MKNTSDQSCLARNLTGSERTQAQVRRACLVLPTYNEAENIDLLIPRIFAEAGRIKTHELHVIVVDDSSPDGTEEVVRKYTLDYPHLHLLSGKKKGLGEAYKRGFIAALEQFDADLVIQMDADLQHDPSLIPQFVALTDRGFTVVIGSRFIPGGRSPDFSLRRKMLSYTANYLFRLFTGLSQIHDCTSGFRCIKADLMRKCDLSYLSAHGYSFISGLLFELTRRGGRVVEIPMIFPDRVWGESKLCFRDEFEFLVDVFRILVYRVKNGRLGQSNLRVSQRLLASMFRSLKLKISSPNAGRTAFFDTSEGRGDE